MTESSNRVVWSEGLFLQPHHLQQQERWIEQTLQSTARPLRLFPWGLASLELNTGLLGSGVLAVLSARGILPDGTPFLMPERDPLPPPIQVDETVKHQVVYLAAPLPLPGEPHVSLEADDAPEARYVAEDLTVRDINSGAGTETTLRTARLRTRLMPERLVRDGYVSIGIARIVERRADGGIILDQSYVPPCFEINASRRLQVWLEELLTALHHRGDMLASRVGTPSTGSLSSFGNFVYLLTVNRLEPVVAHLNALPGLHPEDLYRTLVQIAGELSTFLESRRTPQFPAYRHDDLAGTYEPVIRTLLEALGKVIIDPAEKIEILDRPKNYKVALLQDRTLLADATFVLGAKANMDRERVRRELPDQVKVGTVEELQRLVAKSLPGIALRPADGPPREIPPNAGATYFELDRNSEYWKDLGKSGAFAFFVPDCFPGLELELWAIRR
jgi:type VI secretion system protein ImpJ